MLTSGATEWPSNVERPLVAMPMYLWSDEQMEKYGSGYLKGDASIETTLNLWGCLNRNPFQNSTLDT
jgi:hypothetical protein